MFERRLRVFLTLFGLASVVVFARLAQLRQFEMWRRLVDKRRRHLARVEAEAHEEETGQNGEDRERDDKTVHFSAVKVAAGNSQAAAVLPVGSVCSRRAAIR